MMRKGGLPGLRAAKGAEADAPRPPREAQPLTDFSTAAVLALAETLPSSGIVLTDADAARLRSAATTDCALARAHLLKAAGRVSSALALLRAAPGLAASRALGLDLTLRAAALDEEFARLIADADGARDRGDWASAEGFYQRALELYPLHSGYRVQLGHMLKEQGRFGAAEIAYRTAMALGAPVMDVSRHLAFVCERQGYELREPPRPRDAARPMDEAPTALDIDALGYLFWHERGVGEADLLDLLRRCATCEAVAASMVADARFVRRNGPLLKMLKARG